MSESVADSHETRSTTDTGHTHQTNDTSSTSVPLARIPQKPVRKNEHDMILPPLPSHKFRHSVWHDLKHSYLKGDELHAPRVRKAPLDREALFSEEAEEGIETHHGLSGPDHVHHIQEQENWSRAEAVNLSFQELNQKYQRDNFYRILHNMTSAVTMNLVNNNMTSLRNHMFPCCEYLNINKNYITSFKDFPYTPRIRCITATYNNVGIFQGLDQYASSPLEELTLIGNPVTFVMHYRKHVFRILPNLRVLDNIPKLPDDEAEPGEELEPPPDQFIVNQKSCVIS